MKKLLLLLMLLCPVLASAQDVIVKTDYSTIACKVLEITSTEVKYKKFSNLDGPTYVMSKTEIQVINYENGEQDKFEDEKTIPSPQRESYQFNIANMSKGQKLDVNVIVDYSEATICGMDEESFALVETDWYKDKPDIDQNLIQELMKKTSSFLTLKLSSPYTLLVKVKSIDKYGIYSCNARIMDPNNFSILSVNPISFFGGKVYMSTLRKIKSGAKKAGSYLGDAFVKEFEIIVKQPHD